MGETTIIFYILDVGPTINEKIKLAQKNFKRNRTMLIHF